MHNNPIENKDFTDPERRGGGGNPLGLNLRLRVKYFVPCLIKTLKSQILSRKYYVIMTPISRP